MNFVEGLPTSHVKYAILVVVDILRKYALLIVLYHSFTTASGAQVFMDKIYKLY